MTNGTQAYAVKADSPEKENPLRTAEMTLEDDYYAPLLIFGGISLAVGIALFIGFFVGRKMLEKEIEAEEKSMEQE